MDLSQSIELGVAASVTAILGSMLGLGGGVFLVPIFTLFFGVDQKLAIGASAVAVATNSVVGSTVHLESRFTNIRFAMMMEVTTAFGALIGAIIGVWAPEKAINFIFASVLVYSAVSMAIRRAALLRSPLMRRTHMAWPANIAIRPRGHSSGMCLSACASVSR